MAGIWFEQAINDRQAGWAFVRQLLENKQVKTWEGRGGYLINTIYNLVRRPGTEDIKDKQNDHSADTFRYAMMAFYEGTGRVGPPEDTPPDPNVDHYFPTVIESLQPHSGSTSLGLGEGF